MNSVSGSPAQRASAKQVSARQASAKHASAGRRAPGRPSPLQPGPVQRLAAADLPAQLAATPRQARGRQRQQALIEAGLHLTATRDWADVTVGDIAAAIGCSVGTFYTRFHDKDSYFAVLSGLVCELLQQRADAFFAAPERAQEDAASFVTAWVRLVCQSFALHRGLYAAAVLDLRRHAPAARHGLPLVQLRDRGRQQWLAAMARWPAWRGAAAQARLQLAHQVLQGTLINAVLTDPGPLKLDDPALAPQLGTVVLACLGLAPAPATTPAPAATTTTRPRKAAAARQG